MDVRVQEHVGGRDIDTLIECKDYNPATTGPVGIELVDAFDSKLRDLSMPFGAIVSNAGFTDGALQKAGRLGISALSVMRQGDSRIRFQVSEYIYLRRVTITAWNLAVPFQSEVFSRTPLESIRVNGLPLFEWLVHRTMLFLGINPIMRGTYSAPYHFSSPIVLECHGGTVETSEMTLTVTVSGAWFEQKVHLDSTTAIYDWARRRARLPKGSGTLQVRGLDFATAVRVQLPPPRYLQPDALRGGEVDLTFAMFQRFPVNGRAMPELEALLPADDLDVILKTVSTDLYESDPAFTDDTGLPMPTDTPATS
jgi:hypothetical protein